MGLIRQVRADRLLPGMWVDLMDVAGPPGGPVRIGAVRWRDGRVVVEAGPHSVALDRWEQVRAWEEAA